jgi:hypothetical protein
VRAEQPQQATARERMHDEEGCRRWVDVQLLIVLSSKGAMLKVAADRAAVQHYVCSPLLPDDLAG